MSGHRFLGVEIVLIVDTIGLGVTLSTLVKYVELRMGLYARTVKGKCGYRDRGWPIYSATIPPVPGDSCNCSNNKKEKALLVKETYKHPPTYVSVLRDSLSLLNKNNDCLWYEAK